MYVRHGQCKEVVMNLKANVWILAAAAAAAAAQEHGKIMAVSYTHLTLPTKA